ncbi:MAG TPA: ribose-5-phosphate isomerase RpiA [Caulobacteraceae bacterium]
MSEPASIESEKRAAGEAAAALVETGMTVGLGTGSTAALFVRALAERRLGVRCVATSEATAALAGSLGLNIVAFDGTEAIDLTVDGADEIGPGLSLIKGGGAALLREKLVWSASRRCVVIADAGKPKQRLGSYPLPIEVIPFGGALTARRISAVLADGGIDAVPVLRVRDGAPVRTDSGNLIYDAPCRAIEDPPALAAALKAVTGVVDHGLFLGMAERALIGTPDGVVTLYP